MALAPEIISSMLAAHLKSIGSKSVGQMTEIYEVGHAVQHLLCSELEALAKLQAQEDVRDVYPGMETEYCCEFICRATVAIMSMTPNEAHEAICKLFKDLEASLAAAIREAK